MPINTNDTLPKIDLVTASADGPKKLSFDELFAGKNVAVFSVPGAFTPTCSAKHLPSYLNNLDALKAKGIDAIYCLAVNDAFVMKAWADSEDALGKITFIADGNADFTSALGLELDASGFGMGKRGQRFSFVAKDGVVTNLFIEGAGEYKVSSAEHMLANI